MTEDEAKTKWCPFARVNSTVRDRHYSIVTIVAGGNRVIDVDEVHENPAQARCIGSACMMWTRQTLDRGYCGLAPPPVVITGETPPYVVPFSG